MQQRPVSYLEIDFKQKVKGLSAGDQLSTKLYEILLPYNSL